MWQFSSFLLCLFYKVIEQVSTTINKSQLSLQKSIYFTEDFFPKKPNLLYLIEFLKVPAFQMETQRSFGGFT